MVAYREATIGPEINSGYPKNGSFGCPEPNTNGPQQNSPSNEFTDADLRDKRQVSLTSDARISKLDLCRGSLKWRSVDFLKLQRRPFGWPFHAKMGFISTSYKFPPTNKPQTRCFSRKKRTWACLFVEGTRRLKGTKRTTTTLVGPLKTGKGEILFRNDSLLNVISLFPTFSNEPMRGMDSSLNQPTRPPHQK